MKKLAILCVLLTLGSIVFAQNFVLDNSGTDWVSWTTMEKEKYILGWMSALSAMIELIEYWQENYEVLEATNNTLDTLRMWGFYRGTTVRDIIKVLDRVYTDPGTRKYKIYDVLLTSYDKEWW